jgi:hypothetical protein
MYIQNGKVYFESKHTNKEVKDKIVNAKGSKDICKDMSSSVNVSEVKLLKTLKRILYIIQENKQLKSNKLPVVQWRITNKKKNFRVRLP